MRPRLAQDITPAPDEREPIALTLLTTAPPTPEEIEAAATNLEAEATEALLEGEEPLEVSGERLRIVVPHRPATLLGEAELAKRIEEDKGYPHGARAHETFEELARRGPREGIPLAIELFARVEERPGDRGLRRSLTKILRSRNYGEVEVALLKRSKAEGTSGAKKALTDLPALAAAAPSANEAEEILDRFCDLDDDTARRVALRCGRNLVGAGGPGFVSTELRERVATLSREHTDHGVRVALFLHAVPIMQSEEVLTTRALKSTNSEVRAIGAVELLRRGRREPAIDFAREEPEASVLRRVLDAAVAPFPLELMERFLGLEDDDLTQMVLLRLPELPADDAAGAAALLTPYLSSECLKTRSLAIWAAGMVGSGKDQIEPILAGLKQNADDLGQVALSLVALARLGYEHCGEALTAWGSRLLKGGSCSWGEEVVDLVGLLLGHQVDGREVLGRFLVAKPLGPIRMARALEIAHALAAKGDLAHARAIRPLLPTRLTRYAELEGQLSG